MYSMKATIALFGISMLVSMSPASAKRVEVCRPRTNNTLQSVSQKIAYPTTSLCKRPYVELKNSLTQPRSINELWNDFWSGNFRFRDASGKKYYPCSDNRPEVCPND